MISSKILFIGNDPVAQRAIAETMKSEELVLITACDAQSGLVQATVAYPQLVIVDLQSPATANLEFCKQLRSSLIEIPVVVLSPIEDEIENVLLETGADDYVVKPFRPRELLARIRARLSRARHSAHIHQFSDVGINLTQRIVNKGGEEVKLTRAEYNLLAFFLQHSGRVVTRDMILNSVWGCDAYLNTRTVDVHVMRLRQKLEPDQGVARHFRTVHGVGYRFVPHG
jgi:DNA-binding response OmpR family regulator